MIIDGHRFAKYLRDTKLKAEEFWLLYRIMILEQNVVQGVLRLPVMEDDAAIEFSKMSEEYQRLHVPGDDDPTWIDKCFSLQKKGFVEIWNKVDGVIKLSEIKVTDKFKSFFFISDIEAAFKEVLELYPSFVYVNSSRYLSKDKPLDQLQNLYDKHVLKGGGALNHERFMLITKMYLDKNKFTITAPYKLSRFIELFDILAEEMEKSPSGDPFNEEL